MPPKPPTRCARAIGRGCAVAPANEATTSRSARSSSDRAIPVASVVPARSSTRGTDGIRRKLLVYVAPCDMGNTGANPGLYPQLSPGSDLPVHGHGLSGLEGRE